MCIGFSPFTQVTNLTIIFNLFVCAVHVCAVHLFGNYSQVIGPKVLKFSGFPGVNPGEIIRKFGEDRSKTIPIRPL